ncbi:thiol:disulfide interchange protein DsbA/DsbL [Rhodanobacter lindaniclasticus]|uniref:Protein-disulfide isomerase n=1 Tax=Rhodanobacter lindaniclasticus TaxID=75310 RepID=A0A4S3KFM0_9GAMM|nr:thiol:disulfide interchange protein DsbA/DsbL [Rhodanobacter lindaniclasticus]THD06734.1 protein-disulfide isomerase [Rhodanobacter lindaniclasticus]
MFKRLPILCVILLALAACSSHDEGQPAAAPAASSTMTAPATPASAPAPATSAPAVDDSSAPATAVSAAPAPAESAPTAAAPAVPFVDNGKWVEGKNYFLIEPAQPTSHPGKIEVTEVFSFGCPACNAFHATADQIRKSLPAGAVMNYLPAAFRPDENWVVYQRAFYAAQALGVAEKSYDAMFDATWKTGETATYNLKGTGLKPKEAWPTIEDIAKFYAQFGVDPKEFVAVANSFSVNTRMKRADDLIKAYGIDGTPSMVVNGKYRYGPSTAGGYAQTIELTQWLVAKEQAGK